MNRDLWTLNSSTLAWQRENAGDNRCFSLHKAEGLRLVQGNAADKGSRTRLYSETPGLASGPATYQPPDLGHHHPTSSYLWSLTGTIEIVIPTLHPGRVTGDNCRQKHLPTGKHETGGVPVSASAPQLPKARRGPARGHAVPGRRV